MPPDGDGDGDDDRDGVSDREAALLGENDGEAATDEVTEAVTEEAGVRERPVEADAAGDADMDGVLETDTTDADAEGEGDGDTDDVNGTEADGVTETDGVGDTAAPPANVTTELEAPDTVTWRTTLFPVSLTRSVLLLETAMAYGWLNNAPVPTPFA